MTNFKNHDEILDAMLDDDGVYTVMEMAKAQKWAVISYGFGLDMGKAEQEVFDIQAMLDADEFITDEQWINAAQAAINQVEKPVLLNNKNLVDDGMTRNGIFCVHADVCETVSDLDTNADFDDYKSRCSYCGYFLNRAFVLDALYHTNTFEKRLENAKQDGYQEGYLEGNADTINQVETPITMINDKGLVCDGDSRQKVFNDLTNVIATQPFTPFGTAEKQANEFISRIRKTSHIDSPHQAKKKLQEAKAEGYKEGYLARSETVRMAFHDGYKSGYDAGAAELTNKYSKLRNQSLIREVEHAAKVVRLQSEQPNEHEPINEPNTHSEKDVNNSERTCSTCTNETYNSVRSKTCLVRYRCKDFSAWEPKELEPEPQDSVELLARDLMDSKSFYFNDAIPQETRLDDALKRAERLTGGEQE